MRPWLARLGVLFVWMACLTPSLALAKIEQINIERKEVATLIEKEVRDPFPYFGLAAFYNGVDAWILDEEAKTLHRLGSEVTSLQPGQVLAIVGHYRILLFRGLHESVSFHDGLLSWHKENTSGEPGASNTIHASLLSKSELGELPAVWQKLKYVHLWTPLQLLCIGIEAVLLWLNSMHSLGWGISIVLLSLLFKIFILPANILLTRSQRKISHIQVRLAPDLAHIKANYAGEEAHQKFMAAHKKQGVTPFYSLRPLLPTLLPLPFLIAIFNVLGEMDLLLGHSFLWIHDLARPDAIYDFGFHIPLLGHTINLMPFLMTALTVFAALLHANNIVTEKELRRQRLNLYLMAGGFFILFYSFPAAMVLYWTLANVWQTIQSRIIRI